MIKEITATIIFILCAWNVFNNPDHPSFKPYEYFDIAKNGCDLWQ